MKKASLISPVKYATLANYSPRGQSDLSKHSRNSCYGFKNGNAETLSNFSLFLRNECKRTDIFTGFLGDDIVLVPAPRSSLLVTGGIWPSQLIAREIIKVGLAREIMPCLERTQSIKKSASSSQGNRPTVEEHYNSLLVKKLEVFSPNKITIVDDVLTKGRTAFACALRLSEAFPGAELRVFTPIRTQGFIDDIPQFIEPATGEIIFDGYTDVNRHP